MCRQNTVRTVGHATYSWSCKYWVYYILLYDEAHTDAAGLPSSFGAIEKSSLSKVWFVDDEEDDEEGEFGAENT